MRSTQFFIVLLLFVIGLALGQDCDDESRLDNCHMCMATTGCSWCPSSVGYCMNAKVDICTEPALTSTDNCPMKSKGDIVVKQLSEERARAKRQIALDCYNQTACDGCLNIQVSNDSLCYFCAILNPDKSFNKTACLPITVDINYSPVCNQDNSIDTPNLPNGNTPESCVYYPPTPTTTSSSTGTGSTTGSLSSRDVAGIVIGTVLGGFLILLVLIACVLYILYRSGKTAFAAGNA